MAWLLCAIVAVLLGAGIGAAIADYGLWATFRGEWSNALSDLADDAFGLWNFFVAPVLLLSAVVLLHASRVGARSVTLLRRVLIALAALELLLAPGVLVSGLLSRSIVASRFGWDINATVTSAAIMVTRILICLAVLAGAWALSERNEQLPDRFKSEDEPTTRAAVQVDESDDRPPEAPRTGWRGAYAMAVVTAVAAASTLITGAVLAAIEVRNYHNVVAPDPGSTWQNISAALSSLGDGIAYGNFNQVDGPLLLVLAVILLRASRSRTRGAYVLTRCLAALSIAGLVVMIGYVCANVIPSANFDGAGTWAEFVGWCLVRALLYLVALVGARSLPTIRRSGVVEETVGSSSESAAVPIKALGAEEQRPEARRWVAGSLVLMVLATGSLLVFGLGEAFYAAVSFDSGLQPDTSASWWDILNSALQSLATPYGGEFVSIVGPVLLVLAVLLVGVSHFQRLTSMKFCFWLTLVATLELIVTLLVALAQLVPYTGWSSNTLVGFVDNSGIQVLLCSAAILGATRIQSKARAPGAPEVTA